MRRLLLAGAIALGLTSPALAQGTLRVAVGTTITQLDPALTTIGDEYIYVHLVFNGLTRIERDLTVKPDLAVSWTATLVTQHLKAAHHVFSALIHWTTGAPLGGSRVTMNLRLARAALATGAVAPIGT